MQRRQWPPFGWVWRWLLVLWWFQHRFIFIFWCYDPYVLLVDWYFICVLVCTLQAFSLPIHRGVGGSRPCAGDPLGRWSSLEVRIGVVEDLDLSNRHLLLCIPFLLKLSINQVVHLYFAFISTILRLSPGNQIKFSNVLARSEIKGFPFSYIVSLSVILLLKVYTHIQVFYW